MKLLLKMKQSIRILSEISVCLLKKYHYKFIMGKEYIPLLIGEKKYKLFLSEVKRVYRAKRNRRPAIPNYENPQICESNKLEMEFEPLALLAK